MIGFKEFMKNGKRIIGMVHVRALPGTPLNTQSPDEILKIAIHEAKVYKRHGIKAVIIENMFDVPYTKTIRPEVISMMSVIGHEIKKLGLYCGIQILAGGNKEALAAAKAAGLDFIRAEGFVFAHIGDEGYFDSCAGELLRYRKSIGAEDILVFTDIKKKHSSHAITADVSIYETAKAAEFFLTDGIVITGVSTGAEPDMSDLESVREIKVPKLIGSGITADNITRYFGLADIFIVGSYFKTNGQWQNRLDEKRIGKLMSVWNDLVSGSEK